MTRRKTKNAWIYVAGIAIALIVGAVSGFASMNGMKEFALLKQPPLSPPGWLFPVVWTILYSLMGISSAIVFIKNTIDTKRALTIYAAQLFVNALWAPIFFGLELRLVAFVWLLILIVLVVKMIAEFKKVDDTAGNIQFPYLIWLLFAGYLNLAVFLINR